MYLANNHYDLVTSVPALLGRSYFCHKCDKPYNDPTHHKCKLRCEGCKRIGAEFPCRGTNWIHCNDCGLHFVNKDCFTAHKTPKGEVLVGKGKENRRKVTMTICQRFYLCSKCDEVVDRSRLQRGEIHTCYTRFCKVRY